VYQNKSKSDNHTLFSQMFGIHSFVGNTLLKSLQNVLCLRRGSLYLLLLRRSFLGSFYHSYIRLSIDIDALSLHRVTYIHRDRRALEVLAATDEVPADTDRRETCEDDGGVVHGLCCDGETGVKVSIVPTEKPFFWNSYLTGMQNSTTASTIQIKQTMLIV
jgi:hypothetical protein